MNLAERVAANDDFGYDEDSVHALLKKHEVRKQFFFEKSYFSPFETRPDKMFEIFLSLLM